MASLQAPRQQCRAAPPAAAVHALRGFSPLFLMADFLMKNGIPVCGYLSISLCVAFCSNSELGIAPPNLPGKANESTSALFSCRCSRCARSTR